MKLIHFASIFFLSSPIAVTLCEDKLLYDGKAKVVPDVVGIWKSERNTLTLRPDRRFQMNGGPKIDSGIWEESRDGGFYLRYRARNVGEAGLSRAGHFVFEQGEIVFSHDDELERFEKIGELERPEESGTQASEGQGEQVGSIKLINDFSKRVSLLLEDFKELKPGMSRKEIRKLFPRDGGIHGVSQERFVHPECPYFKVDVEFEFKRDPDDQNRAIFGDDDRATTISKPYIEGPILD